MARLLLVDDEAPLRRLLRGVLAGDGHEVVEADGVAAARDHLRRDVFDVVLTDHRMAGATGLDLIVGRTLADPPPPVIMITAYASVELAVEAMRAGAFDFIAKPFEPRIVRSAVRRAAEQTRLLRANRRLRGEITRLHETELIGTSPAMAHLRERIARVAATRSTVLIVGETGSGKELVARAVHEASPRADQPFLAVNCAALPDNLLESELFGHEAGAFTGADGPRCGLFEAAHGGTLLLDEAGDMSPALQAKLLRVLMDGSFSRLGSAVERRADVRIIAATHRDLRQRVAAGSFREDLYYRLAVVLLEVPPLRDRPDDLPALSAALLTRVCNEMGLPPRRLAPGALEALARHPFPGNVRELRNLLERAALLADSAEIQPAHLALAPAATPPAGGLDALAGQLTAGPLPEGGLRAALEQIERRAIAETLVQCGGVQAEAARRLGMTKADLFYRVQKYHLHDKPAEPDAPAR